MLQVKDKREEEFDWILSVARLYDEGFPSLDHVHDGTDRVSPSPRCDKSSTGETTLGECAKSDAPSVVGTRRTEIFS